MNWTSSIISPISISPTKSTMKPRLLGVNEQRCKRRENIASTGAVPKYCRRTCVLYGWSLLQTMKTSFQFTCLCRLCFVTLRKTHIDCFVEVIIQKLCPHRTDLFPTRAGSILLKKARIEFIPTTGEYAFLWSMCGIWKKNLCNETSFVPLNLSMHITFDCKDPYEIDKSFVWECKGQFSSSFRSR